MAETLTDKQRYLLEIQQKRVEFDEIKQEYLNAPLEELSEKFGIPLLSKIPISEDSIEESENGTPILLQNNKTPTKEAMQDLVNTIIKVLPPVSDETCTGRLAKVLEELEVEA